MFYYKNKEKFIFGSEIKFLKKALKNQITVNSDKLKKNLLLVTKYLTMINLHFIIQLIK